ncbi:MAG TPA: hypothetical protein VIL29_05140 [Pseudothermotoga sp.]|uniref:hypothetical protein n=1 Tax=Thermotoga profunda TaxID=1508420 RepID=UPI0005974BD8|nr:hypothetical protein [Thermotoga profunda]
MKKFLLIIETVAGFICFLFFLKIDVMFALCTLVFSLIYLFGIVDFRKNPQRIDAHLMVGGAMFFIAMCFMILDDLSDFELSASRLLMIIMGSIGIVQMLIFRSKFK